MHGAIVAAVRSDALVNLNHPNHFLSWGWLSLSASNAIVIGVMVVTFVAAILIPFPNGGSDE